MRQPTTTVLRLLVDALPDEALRPLLIELLQTSATPTVAPMATEATAPAPAAKRKGWPRGKARGQRTAAAAPDAAHRAKLDKRNAALATKRAAARAAKAHTNGGSGSTDGGDGAAVSPTTFWQHAEKLSPRAPWKALRPFGINEALALDAHRLGRLPPGLGPAEAARFLGMPAA